MKAILLVALMLTGCASVSDYNQGCRDGVIGVGFKNYSEKEVNKYCDGVEAKRKLEKETHESKRP